MKHRILVMNGQRLLQSDQGGHWATEKVEKAGALKPGIYNIHLSTIADTNKSYQGQILHIDSKFIYQSVGRSFVKHDRMAFDAVPDSGGSCTVSYSQGKALANSTSMKRGRGIS